MTHSQAIHTLVIGGGPAGLATSYCLKQRSIPHLVLERGPTVGTTWVHFYESLRLHTGKHLSHLPGLPFPAGTPLFPSRAEFVAYLQDYAARFALPIELESEVLRVGQDQDGTWLLEGNRASYRAKNLVAATGIVSQPFRPHFPGEELFRGSILHSVSYRRPENFQGKNVLVVGVGNSGAEIAAELGESGAKVDLAVRSGAYIVPLSLAGVPIQYFSILLQKLPLHIAEGIAAGLRRITALRRGPSPLPPPHHRVFERPPVIGFRLSDAVAAGLVRIRPDLKIISPEGVTFVDGRTGTFDVIILATGFRPALAMFGDLLTLDDRGCARRERVKSLDRLGLYFMGQNFGAIGALKNISDDAPLVADLIARSSV